MFKPFRGTVDDLFVHVSNNINADEVSEVAEGTSELTLDDAEALTYLESELGVDRETAQDILLEIKTAEIERIMLNLKDQGLVNIIDGKDGGEVMYELTTNGKYLVESLKKG